jgi:release factor glutamine methyltransferase
LAHADRSRRPGSGERYSGSLPDLPPSSFADLVERLRSAGCVFAEDEAALLTAATTSAIELEMMVADRVSGLPLEHVLGWAQFCGRRIIVEPDVFIPRRRTEHLVARALLLVRPGAAVLDMCCGSGAVGAALLAAVPSILLYATDVDPAAVRCARRNVAPNRVFEGDLYDPLPSYLRGCVDLIVANAPYVPTYGLSTMPPEARLHEPRVALDGGPDGLDVQRAVIAGASEWLAVGGRLLIETSRSQATGTAATLTGHGFDAMISTDDDLDATVVIGTR